jgi:predicted Fe-Mo cluster-binding NifX family protein
LRIAIPSDDERTISAHPGRSAGFLIYLIEGHQVRKEAFRKNPEAESHASGPGDQAEANHQTYDGMTKMLRDCDTVLAAGMGPSLLDNLESEGFQVIFTYETDAEEAVRALVEGKLITEQARSRCHRH